MKGVKTGFSGINAHWTEAKLLKTKEDCGQRVALGVNRESECPADLSGNVTLHFTVFMRGLGVRCEPIRKPASPVRESAPT